jgi:ribosomal protein L11 methyltransferase
MKNFFVYKIFTHPFDPDLLSGVLWEFEITGLLENDNYISVFTSDNSSAGEEYFNAALMKLKNKKLIDSFRIEKEIIEDKNWNEEWEKSREVIRISHKLIIKPSFRQYTPTAGEIVLTIDPKMSFGTGEHATTKLMLRLLEEFVKPGMKVLDVGSGTGILSIAAIKLGALSATAVDIDPVCYENCIENCRVNSAEDSVTVITGEIAEIKEKDFDLAAANIQTNVLISISNEIKERLKNKGIVILSGILAQEKNEATIHYTKAGFRLIREEMTDEWAALVFKTAG